MTNQAFATWLGVDAFEGLFWSVKAEIRKNGCWIDVQHPRKPDTKHDNEYLPLLIPAKPDETCLLFPICSRISPMDFQTR